MNPKTFFITGCSSGFGRAIATAALAAGHRVIATARDLRDIADFDRPGISAIASLDVTDADRISTVVAEAAGIWSSLDVLVNNAGYGLLGALEECGDAQIRRNMETNFFGPLNLIRSVLPIMRRQGSGHIVNISAAAVIANYPGFGIYGGAKAALEFVSESLRQELAPLGIKVMLVRPGPFRTGFILRSLEKAETTLDVYTNTSGRFAKLIESMDGKQPGDPDRAAHAILSALLSENPPFRLVLGRYAIEKTRRTLAESGKELTAWESLGLSTDCPKSA